MMRTSWLRVGLTGAFLFAAGFLVACSGDDGDDEPEGSTGEGTAVAGEATETPVSVEQPTQPPDGSGAGTGSGTPPAPPSFPTSDEPPVTTASANGETVDTGIGTYCWTLMCVDKIGVATEGTLTVSPGDIVTIAVPSGAPPLREASAAAFEAVDAQQLDDGSQIWPYPGSPGEPIPHETSGENVEVTVELPPGMYVLSVSMYFEAGDVVYGVLLEVQ